ncbi:nucleotide-binding universal stress UspA family protein [Curtobacterium sp. JUb34]|uniref:universal stress protein n=1 Tax=Curtobacterium sp. JUb34 TaxID=2485109 RepID=UPI000F477420|nr:universal stress protein [Curtobacterium sp. JUb34]ROR33413.1 nucleotide-binding universal stress UspA family protein [Curtobacterium sp. JUb34]
MPDPIRWTVAVDESEAAWNMLDWVDGNVGDGDAVRLLTVHELFGESPERSTGRLAIAERRLRSRHPGLRVERHVVSGPTLARLLVDATVSDVLVLGGRRTDRLWAAITGRMAERVVAHATTPVVVVPERPSSSADRDAVVVGVDSRTAAGALAFAAGRAEGRRDGLVLVRAWEPPTSVSPFGRVYLARDRPLWEHEGQLELDAAIRAVSRSRPDLRMRGELRQGTASDVLLRAATTASLVVVGRRHRSALGAFLAGSVGEALLHRASVPVCVVPPDGDTPRA